MANFFIIIFLCLITCSYAFAAPAITCHCFRDRSFDTENPGRIDSYLLATTRNSFLASVSGVSKKEIVGARMSGTPDYDIWIAYFAANNTSIDAGLLMAEKKKNNGSWKTSFAKQNIGEAQLGDQFSEALAADRPDTILAAIAADQMIIKYLGAEPDDIKKLRKNGASTNELILSVFFSSLSGKPSYEFYKSVKSGKMAWGSHMSALGLETGKTEETIKKAFHDKKNTK